MAREVDEEGDGRLIADLEERCKALWEGKQARKLRQRKELEAEEEGEESGGTGFQREVERFPELLVGEPVCNERSVVALVFADLVKVYQSGFELERDETDRRCGLCLQEMRGWRKIEGATGIARYFQRGPASERTLRRLIEREEDVLRDEAFRRRGLVLQEHATACPAFVLGRVFLEHHTLPAERMMRRTIGTAETSARRRLSLERMKLEVHELVQGVRS
ncbi:hypothetical protein DIPPA_24816 [Diplonema papillatum]|nr:hypothetical protein DIPPA_24816 [Diplonema papillatum]